MANTPHTLQDEFPGQAEKISALKASDPRFAKLLVEYDQANDQVHRAETRLDTVSQEHEEALRKTRARLKDAIAAALRA